MKKSYYLQNISSIWLLLTCIVLPPWSNPSLFFIWIISACFHPWLPTVYSHQPEWPIKQKPDHGMSLLRIFQWILIFSKVKIKSFSLAQQPYTICCLYHLPSLTSSFTIFCHSGSLAFSQHRRHHLSQNLCTHWNTLQISIDIYEMKSFTSFKPLLKCQLFSMSLYLAPFEISTSSPLPCWICSPKH